VLSEAVSRKETDLLQLADTVVHQQHELEAALEQASAAREIAERASLVKSNFLRMMSHELRTPLTAMQLQLGLLERDAQLEQSPRLQEGYTRIWRASRRLFHLTETMLEWARVESGRSRLLPERIDLVAAVEEVTNELSAQARQKRLDVEVLLASDLEPTIVSDRRLLGIVLLNLLGRALQLTPAGAVKVRIEQRGERRRVLFEDAAPDRLLPTGDPFDPTQPASGGAGLGLHVVRDIARAISAEVAFENGPGVGHVVALSIPSLEAGVAELPGVAPRASRPAPPAH
jgi:signal transduction histidine kinase